MKRNECRLIAITALFMLITGTCHAFTFPWEKLKPELNLLKADIAKTADAVVKADVKVGENMKALADVRASVGNIEARLNAQGNAIAGFKNQVSNLSSGRDTVQTTTSTNDTSLMRDMINTYRVIILALVVQMIGLVRFTANMYNKIITGQQKELTRVLISKDDKDSKLDAFQNSLISKAFDNATAENFKKDVATAKTKKVLDEIEKAAENDVKGG